MLDNGDLTPSQFPSPDDADHFATLKEILEAVKMRLQEERRALDELDLDKLIALNKETPSFFKKMKELTRTEEDDDVEEEEDSVALPPHIRELLEEVKTMRKENVELSRKIKEILVRELQDSPHNTTADAPQDTPEDV